MACNWIIQLTTPDGTFFLKSVHGELTEDPQKARGWYHRKYALEAAGYIRRCLEPETTSKVGRRQDFVSEPAT